MKQDEVREKVEAAVRLALGSEISDKVIVVMVSLGERTVTADRILAAVEQFTGVKDLRTKTRVLTVVRARWLAFHLLRTKLGWSYPQIGRFFGMDHTSVMSALARWEADPVLRANVKAVEELLA